MERRKHLTLEGLHKILAIRASIKHGLSPKLKLAKNPPPPPPIHFIAVSYDVNWGGVLSNFNKIIFFFLKKIIILLKLAFPDIVPVVKPLVENKKIQYPNWLAGFTTGEDSFIVNIKASKTHSIGFQVLLVF